MKCDRCDQQASVHLTQVVNGKMQKLHLCDQCAQGLGVGPGAAFSLSDLLLGQGAAQPLALAASARKCPECGWTLQRLRKGGRLGCPACYTAFEKELTELLHSIHRADHHVGRRPKHRHQRVLTRDEEEQLESKIALAVAAEDYERAAEIRDQLKALRTVRENGEQTHDS